MKRITCRVFLLSLLLYWPGLVCGQVPEERVTVVLIVDAQQSQASDNNSGTTSLPLKTISKAAALAVQNNRNGIGTKVLIYPGIYRERVIIGVSSKDTDAPIVFEAKTKGTAILSGSDVWDNWEPQAGTSIYTHPWPYMWGFTPYPASWAGQVVLQPIVRRREMVFVNGSTSEQVLSRQELRAGSFYIDEDEGKVYLWPPAGTSPASALIEVATRSGIFRISGKKNVVLRGLTFQHDNTPVDGAAVTVSSSSTLLVEDCQFLWNNWTALMITASQDVTARRNVANFNGGSGIATHKIKGLLFEDNETSYNNWRGAKGGFYGWSVAGIKNLFIHNGTYRRHRSVENLTRGFWLDTDCVDIVVDTTILCGNLADGIFLEANQGPITIQGSTICNNKTGPGILIANSSRVTLEKNILYGNGEAQINVSGYYNQPRKITNWETGGQIFLKTEGWTLKSNVIVSSAPTQRLLKTTLAASFWQSFVSSLTSNNNLWFSPTTSPPFLGASGKQLDFNGWRTYSQQDANSIFSDPRFVDPSNENFTLRADSPLLQMSGWGTPPLAPAAVSTSLIP